MTVKELITRLNEFPQNAKVCFQTEALMDVRKVKYTEDYVYGTTFKIVRLEN